MRDDSLADLNPQQFTTVAASVLFYPAGKKERLDMARVSLGKDWVEPVAVKNRGQYCARSCAPTEIPHFMNSLMTRDVAMYLYNKGASELVWYYLSWLLPFILGKVR